MKYQENVNALIKWGKENVPEFKENELSDGYHTFNELYEFRKLYNAALFNMWAYDWNQYFLDCTKNNKAYLPEKANELVVYDVHKSTKHHDGKECFGGGWFIVVAVLPGGQISNHYKIEDWDLFNIPTYGRARHPFDGHTAKDVLDRLRSLSE